MTGRRAFAYGLLALLVIGALVIAGFGLYQLGVRNAASRSGPGFRQESGFPMHQRGEWFQENHPGPMFGLAMARPSGLNPILGLATLALVVLAIVSVVRLFVDRPAAEPTHESEQTPNTKT
jgi:hypothetical protein